MNGLKEGLVRGARARVLSSAFMYSPPNVAALSSYHEIGTIVVVDFSCVFFQICIGIDNGY